MTAAAAVGASSAFGMPGPFGAGMGAFGTMPLELEEAFDVYGEAGFGMPLTPAGGDGQEQAAVNGQGGFRAPLGDNVAAPLPPAAPAAAAQFAHLEPLLLPMVPSRGADEGSLAHLAPLQPTSL